MKLQITDCTNVGVFAPVCSGKTFLMNEWLKLQNRFVRFDYTGETMGDLGIEHIYNPKELLIRLMNKDKGGDAFFKISYHPGMNVMEHYRWCQRVLWQFDTPRWFAIDELHRIAGQKMGMDPDFEYLARLARHNQMGVIGMSQRPQDVQKLFVDSCRMCVIFRSQEENFLNACAGHWGDDVASAVEQLRPLIFDDKTKIVKQIQQCCVVTRDGQQPRIYDFKTDNFIGISTFLSGINSEQNQELEDEEDGEQSGAQQNNEGAYGRDSHSEGASNRSVRNEETDSGNDGDFPI